MIKDIQIPTLKRQKILWACVTLLPMVVGACSTNPATGDRQFTALMSPQQEVSVGASEHEKIVKQFGLYQNQSLQNYVSQVGQNLAKNTERPDVQYKFYVIDSPIVNAFALPGGYVYVSRGLLALANNEAELAGVVGHEIGHVTARHSAERYSTSVVTSLGAGLIGAVVGNSGVSEALGVGSNLYLSSYSRGQENESDTLGIRYLARAGYDTGAMSSFLASLQNESSLQASIAGSNANQFSYFSTHPATAERVSKTRAEAGQYPHSNARVARNDYLSAIDGMIYGDSPAQGFVRGTDFYHTGLGFKFSAPEGFRMINQPSQVIATSPSGAVIVFDMVAAKGQDPATYLSQVWMKDNQNLGNVERINVNGMKAATGAFPGKVNNRDVTIRLVTIAWGDKMVRFQYAIPQGASQALVDALKQSSYSFKAMSVQEKQSIKPYKVKIVTASAGDSVQGMAARQALSAYKEESFRVLNGLAPNEGLVTGQRYKVIVE